MYQLGERMLIFHLILDTKSRSANCAYDIKVSKF